MDSMLKSLAFSTCYQYLQNVANLVFRHDNLNSTFPYLLASSAIYNLPISVSPMLPLLPLIALYIFKSIRFYHEYFGGHFGFIQSSVNYLAVDPLVLAPLLDPTLTWLHPSLVMVPVHQSYIVVPKHFFGHGTIEPVIHRRCRTYHRHYHRRVKFLHHARPPCPTLSQSSVFRSLLARVRSNFSTFARVSASLLVSFINNIGCCYATVIGLPWSLCYVSSLSTLVYSVVLPLVPAMLPLGFCLLLLPVALRCFSILSHLLDLSPSVTFSQSDLVGPFFSDAPLDGSEGDVLPAVLLENDPSSGFSAKIQPHLLDIYCLGICNLLFGPLLPLNAYVSPWPPDPFLVVKRKFTLPYIPNVVLNYFCKSIDPIKFHRACSFSLESGLGRPFISAFYVTDPCLKEGQYLATSELEHLPIVVDTGASRSLSPRREDFVTYSPMSSKLTGIGSATNVVGKGTVRWEVTDQFGVTHEILAEAYHVPSASIRLYSPQAHFQKLDGGKLIVTKDECRLFLPSHRKNESTNSELSFPFHPKSNLPCMLRSDHPNFFKAMFAVGPSVRQEDHVFASVDHLRRVPAVEEVETYPDNEYRAFLLEEDNLNLNAAQMELLMWHFRLGHVGMERLQKLMRPSLEVGDSPPPSSDSLARPVVISTRQTSTHKCKVPKCKACVLAKMTRRTTNGTTTRADPAHLMSLSRGHCDPGDCVSTDQFVVTNKGRTLRSFGKEKKKNKIAGGTIFKDHASGFISVHNQISLRAGETIVAKKSFERTSGTYGVAIKKYHADNGVFVSEAFRNDIITCGQQLELSGVGGQHQNGRAERSIRTVFSLARALLIHSALYWPDAHDLELWPFAVDYAVWILNNLPDEDGLSPLEKFSRQKFNNYNHLRRSHVWGAPMYVLDPKLQDGQKLPKFNPRSRQGKFLGFSANHSSNVALVLNRRTGAISPQYHVVFDDYFHTVRGASATIEVDLNAIDWDTFITPANSERYLDEVDRDIHPPPPLDPEWTVDDEVDDNVEIIGVHPAPTAASQAPTTPPLAITHQPVHVLPPPPPSEGGTPPPSEGGDADVKLEPTNAAAPEGAHTPVHPSEGATADDQSSSTELEGDFDGEPAVEDASRSVSPVPPIPPPDFPSIDQARDDARRGLRRSNRRRRPNSRIFNDDNITSEFSDNLASDFDSCFLTMDDAIFASKEKFTRADLNAYDIANLDWHSSVSALLASPDLKNEDSRRFFAAMEALQDPDSLELDELPTLALFYLASASSADTPRYHEAMHGPNRDGFVDASVIEISTLQGMNAWTQVPRLPSMNILPSTWAFKIKRFPDGLVRKLKARFCVQGDKQIEGVDFFDTFAPVVQWSTVRLLLVLSLTLNLATKQVDYVSAFCQAPIDEDVYVEPPLGWRRLNRLGLKENFKENHVLKLNRSVYGLRQSPKNFFNLLKGNLERCGFTQSEFDACLFISPKVICVCYVDDCLFFSPDEADIDATIEDIKHCGMDLQVEDSVAGFLGVHIEREMEETTEGVQEKITLLQTGLTDRIITALGLNVKSNGAPTPAIAIPLDKDLDGEVFDHDFNYASVVGMCMYLCNNSRPDISFAVSQCARFTHNPTEKHALYLRRIGRYLLATRDKGLTMSCSKDWKIDCYVDADFAGLYGHEDHADPNSVKSRTGFVIMVGNCPIIWSSKLQTEITLSTMEAEYVACSMACRALIPLRELVLELANAVKIPSHEISNMHTTIWEDNVGALTLAKLELPRMTRRSKHISIKYHWFRSYVTPDNGPKSLDVLKIDSKDQVADIFTKGVGPALFLPLRKMMMGW